MWRCVFVYVNQKFLSVRTKMKFVMSGESVPSSFVSWCLSNVYVWQGMCVCVCDKCGCAHVTENLKKFSKFQNCRLENWCQILSDKVKVKVNIKAKAKNRNA